MNRLKIIFNKINFEKVKVARSCLTLCDPVDCSPPSSSVHGILQARILEWVAISFSLLQIQPRDWTQVLHIAGVFFTIWATREAQNQLSVQSLSHVRLFALLRYNLPMDRGAWRAMVHRVTKNRTRLKQLSTAQCNLPTIKCTHFNCKKKKIRYLRSATQNLLISYMWCKYIHIFAKYISYGYYTTSECIFITS